MLLNVEEMGNFRPLLQILLSVLFAGFILYSCSDDTDDIVPTEVNVTERVNPVYFNEEIIPIFEQNCIFCHSEKHTLEHHYPVTPYLTASVAYDSLMSGGYHITGKKYPLFKGGRYLRRNSDAHIRETARL